MGDVLPNAQALHEQVLTESLLWCELPKVFQELVQRNNRKIEIKPLLSPKKHLGLGVISFPSTCKLDAWADRAAAQVKW